MRLRGLVTLVVDVTAVHLVRERQWHRPDCHEHRAVFLLQPQNVLEACETRRMEEQCLAEREGLKYLERMTPQQPSSIHRMLQETDPAFASQQFHV